MPYLSAGYHAARLKDSQVKRWFATLWPLTLGLVLLAAIGIAARAYTLLGLRTNQLCGSDFPVFYAGGQLVGASSLYSPEAVQAIQQREMGCVSHFAVSIRLPYFFALMKPWSWIPFWYAFWLWRAALAIATGIFIWLWPAPKAWALVICAWSLPLAYGFTNGQDVSFLLMWLALAVALWRKGWDFAAGCALAMCAAKFHLFILLPLFLLYRRKLMMGWLAGSLALLISCFAVQGPIWPKQFLSAISHNIDPSPAMNPNLRAIAHSSLPLEVLLAALVLAASFCVIRGGDFQYGLSAVLVGGILLSHHMVDSDAGLLIPVALMLGWHPKAKYSKIAAIVLVSPIGAIAAPLAQVLILLALLCLLCYEALPPRSEPACS